MVTNGLKEVGFAETGAPIDEKRVVGPCRGVGHSLGCGVGELVVGADDETLEGVGGVHPRGSVNRLGLLFPG